MSEEEVRLWKNIFSKFDFGSGHLDSSNEIIINTIIYYLKSKGLSLSSEEGGLIEITNKFNKGYRNISEQLVKFSLIDKEGAESELIYYFPKDRSNEGKLFLSSPKNKSLTEFNKVEVIDESVLPIKRPNGTGEEIDYYSRNFGSKITTMISSPESLVLNELEIFHRSKDVEFPYASLGEITSHIKVYDIDTDGYDISKPMIEVKDKTPGVTATNSISLISKIKKALKRAAIEPAKDKIYHFTDLNGNFDALNADRDLSYIKSAIEANESLLKDIFKDRSQQIDVVEEDDYENAPIVSVPEIVIPSPQQLSPEIEGNLFEILIKNVTKIHGIYSGTRGNLVLSEVVANLIEKEGLHFKPLTQSITAEYINGINYGKDGIELIDQEGKVYKLFISGDSSRLVNLIGEDKVISVREDVEYPFEDRIKADGYRISKVERTREGFYKNVVDVCFPYSADAILNFYLKKPSIAYYSNQELEAMGVDIDNFIASVAAQRMYYSNVEEFEKNIFSESHFGTRSEFFPQFNKERYHTLDYKNPVEGSTGIHITNGVRNLAPEQFIESYVRDYIGMNYAALNDFLAERESVQRL